MGQVARSEAVFSDLSSTVLTNYRCACALFAFADDPEAKIVTRKIWQVCASRGCSQTGEARLPTSTAINPFRAISWSPRIYLRSRFVGLEKVSTLFPDIAR